MISKELEQEFKDNDIRLETKIDSSNELVVRFNGYIYCFIDKKLDINFNYPVTLKQAELIIKLAKEWQQSGNI